MRLAVIALFIFAALPCCAQTDGGGRDMRVQLFSAQPPQHIAVTAAGPGAWWARCPNCAHQTLSGTLHLPQVSEMVAGGPVTVRDEDHAQVRSASGLWHLKVANGGSIDTVVTLPSERYVAAVLTGETSSNEPHEYLRAMAVVARTFVLRTDAPKAVSGHLPSDICDSTACQAMKLGPVSAAVNDAVRSTAGETVWFGPGRAQVFFSGSCGGTTESAGAVWPRLASLLYLRSFSDPYCVRKDHAAWHAEVSLQQLRQIAAQEGWHLPPDIVSVRIAERTASQRARTLAFVSRTGESRTVAASAVRLAVGRSLGWNLLRSDAYELRLRNETLVFDGRGHGHGVGLCQQGAMEMARTGKSYRDILAFYFPGTSIRITRADTGWAQQTVHGITITSAAPPTPGQVQDAVAAWTLATSRFPLQRTILPAVTFAPTTEMFRQLTGRPGWDMASTSGSTVVVQPAEVITANHVALRSLLQHEMLHVAVESNASSKAPLWLREGLVEVLAGEADHATSALPAEATERLLQHAATQQESQAAHHAAAARTQRLVDRYGISTVRGWLISGAAVPAD